MTNTACISFRNPHGDILHGILHSPDSTAARGVCVLLLSPGIKGRVGPHRLYVKIASRFVHAGFHVLRFDFSGLGDSQGTISEAVLVDMYNTIHGGRYVSDTIAAMDWMQETTGVSRFVGSGLCGGSISALLTAARDSRIECLLGIGLPIALDGGPDNWARSLTRGQLDRLRGNYFRKLLRPNSWLRLLSGRSDYLVLWRSLRPNATRLESIARDSARSPTDNTNPLFAGAFRSLVESNRKMLLIFSENDRLSFEFAEKFEARNPDLAALRGGAYDIFVIPGANHVMSDKESVETLINQSERWLIGRYPKSHLERAEALGSATQ